MNDILEFKGYRAKIEFDSRDDVLVGRVLHLQDVISFEGHSVQEIRQAFENAIEDYFDGCRENGVEPEKPFSGKMALRMDPDLHRAVAIHATRSGKSINSFIVSVLQEAVSERPQPSAWKKESAFLSVALPTQEAVRFTPVALSALSRSNAFFQVTAQWPSMGNPHPFRGRLRVGLPTSQIKASESTVQTLKSMGADEYADRLN